MNKILKYKTKVATHANMNHITAQCSQAILYKIWIKGKKKKSHSSKLMNSHKFKILWNKNK